MTLQARAASTQGRRAWAADNPGNRAARAELLAALLEAAGPWLGGEQALLDCGCGSGWLLAELVAAGVASQRLHGVDTDPARVATASRRVPGAEIGAADAAELPYPDSSFGVVFHIVSLSSMGSPQSLRAILAETRRVLAPGGALVVYEPRLPNPLNRSTRRLRRGDLGSAGLPVTWSRSLTLLPPLGRRLGRLTPLLHPRLSRVPALRSHRLLVHSDRAGDRAGAARRPR